MAGGRVKGVAWAALLLTATLAACAPEPGPMMEALGRGENILLDIAMVEAKASSEAALMNSVATALHAAGRGEEASALALEALQSLPREGSEVPSAAASLGCWYDPECQALQRVVMTPDDLAAAEAWIDGIDWDKFVYVHPDYPPGSGGPTDPEPYIELFAGWVRDYRNGLIMEIALRWIAIGQVGVGWSLAEEIDRPGCSPRQSIVHQYGVQNPCAPPSWRHVGTAAVTGFLSAGEVEAAHGVAREMEARGEWPEGNQAAIVLLVGWLALGEWEQALAAAEETGPDRLATVYGFVIESVVESGDLDRAVAIYRALPFSLREGSRWLLFYRAKEVGRLGLARGLWDETPPQSNRIWHLTRLAASTPGRAESLALLAEAKGLLLGFEAAEPPGSSGLEYGAIELADAYLLLGEHEEAWQAVMLAPRPRANKLLEVFKSRVEAGDIAGALGDCERLPPTGLENEEYAASMLWECALLAVETGTEHLARRHSAQAASRQGQQSTGLEEAYQRAVVARGWADALLDHLQTLGIRHGNSPWGEHLFLAGLQGLDAVVPGPEGAAPGSAEGMRLFHLAGEAARYLNERVGQDGGTAEVEAEFFGRVDLAVGRGPPLAVASTLGRYMDSRSPLTVLAEWMVASGKGLWLVPGVVERIPIRAQRAYAMLSTMPPHGKEPDEMDSALVDQALSLLSAPLAEGPAVRSTGVYFSLAERLANNGKLNLAVAVLARMPGSQGYAAHSNQGTSTILRNLEAEVLAKGDATLFLTLTALWNDTDRASRRASGISAYWSAGRVDQAWAVATGMAPEGRSQGFARLSNLHHQAGEAEQALQAAESAAENLPGPVCEEGYRDWLRNGMPAVAIEAGRADIAIAIALSAPTVGNRVAAAIVAHRLVEEGGGLAPDQAATLARWREPTCA